VGKTDAVLEATVLGPGGKLDVVEREYRRTQPEVDARYEEFLR
jgi:hypothetical protein